MPTRQHSIRRRSTRTPLLPVRYPVNMIAEKDGAQAPRSTATTGTPSVKTPAGIQMPRQMHRPLQNTLQLDHLEPFERCGSPETPFLGRWPMHSILWVYSSLVRAYLQILPKRCSKGIGLSSAARPCMNDQFEITLLTARITPHSNSVGATGRPSAFAPSSILLGGVGRALAMQEFSKSTSQSADIKCFKADS